MSDYQRIMYQYITTVIGVVVVICNGLMITYIRFARSYRENPIGYVYIVNMATTDLVAGLIMVILKSMHAYMDTELAGNSLATEFYHVLRFCMVRFSLLTSVLNLVALTMDRLCVVCFPFLAARTRRVNFHVKICVGIWTVSLAFTLLFYTYARFYLNDAEKYINVIFPIATLPATVLFVVSYTLIFSVVNRTSNTVCQQTLSVRKNDWRLDSGNETRKNSITAQKKKVRFIRLAVKTVAVFVVCWLPLSILSIAKTSAMNIHPILESTCFTIAFANSIVNPFIYFTHLRKVIAKTMGCLTTASDKTMGYENSPMKL